MFKNTPLHDRSEKAQEKFADHLMSVSASIITATSIGVLVVPLGAFINSYIAPNAPSFSWQAIFTGLQGFNVLAFAILYFAPLAVAMAARSTALKIYDHLHQHGIRKKRIAINRNTLNKTSTSSR